MDIDVKVEGLDALLVMVKSMLGTLNREDRPKNLVKIHLEMTGRGPDIKVPIRGATITLLVWELAEYDLRVFYDSKPGFYMTRNPLFDSSDWRVAIPPEGERIDRSRPRTPLYDYRDLDCSNPYSDFELAVLGVILELCQKIQDISFCPTITSASLSFVEGDWPELIPFVNGEVDEKRRVFSFEHAALAYASKERLRS